MQPARPKLSPHRVLALLTVAASLAACERELPNLTTDSPIKAGGLGAMIDRPPPQPTTVTGGPSGALIQGPVPPALPESSVEAAVAGSLRAWLTPAERASLAQATQAAAVAPTGAVVPWQAINGAGLSTADGSITPTADVYRSHHGQICRDLRQAVQKHGDWHLQQATMCRTDLGAGLNVWLLARTE